LTKAIELDPKLAAAWVNRGGTYFDMGRYDKAVGDFTNAIKLSPRGAGHWRSRGLAYLRWQRYDKAVADFSRAIDLEPKNALYRINRGQAYTQLRRYDKALADFDKAVALDPRSAIAHKYLAWWLATCPVARLRDPARAVELANKATKFAPTDGLYWNTLGVAHYRAGNWKDAVAALEQSMKLRQGGDCSDWFILAMAHARLGDKEKGRALFDRAARWLDRNQPGNEELGRFRREAEEVLAIRK
jgi:tetratricopeptide (TPR) repeat protein